MPQQPPARPAPSAHVTAAEISRIAGVTRATVSNWRRRHDDFPAPSAGTESSPLYDLPTVQAWLRGRGHTSAASPTEELRTALRLLGPGSGVAARLFPLVAAASRRTPDELAELAAVPDDQLLARAEKAAGGLPATVPEAEPVHYGPDDAGAVRALLGCVREAGAQAALDVLAERELDEGAASGVYQTPEGLARLMARLLPADVSRVLDPACGSGTLLAAAARQGARELFGQDSLPVQGQRTAVRLLIAAPEAETAIRVGDSLRADAFPDVTVDAVLCNPPFADRDWGHDELAYDPRWAYGVPPRFESELAWVQHALAHLEPGGHAVMLLPPALAFRSSGRRVRSELIRGGALRAVVSLPARAAYPLHIGLQIWVFQRPEPGGTDRAAVLFVDGEGEQRDSAAGMPSATGTATAGAGSAAARAPAGPALPLPRPPPPPLRPPPPPSTGRGCRSGSSASGPRSPPPPTPTPTSPASPARCRSSTSSTTSSTSPRPAMSGRPRPTSTRRPWPGASTTCTSNWPSRSPPWPPPPRPAACSRPVPRPASGVRRPSPTWHAAAP